MTVDGSQATRLNRLRLLSLMLVAPALGWYAWSLGRRETPSAWDVRRFQVRGGSMAPTLLGQSGQMRCDGCRMVWDVQLAEPTARRDRPRCPHCGDWLAVVEGTGRDGHQRPGPDVVEIRPQRINASGLRRGDLVAVGWEGDLHVKRIAALPGETIQLEGLRLMVGGRRLEDLILSDNDSIELPRFLVDRDDRRSKSRWSPDATEPTWMRTPDRQWSIGQFDQTRWLVYQHQSVYDQNRPSPVWDDYPFNVGLQRKMYGVDRFCLEGRAIAEGSVSLDVAFWSRDGNLLASLEATADQRFRVSCRDARPGTDLPVSADRPLAIRVADGPVTLSGLTIHRWVEYRLRPFDDRTPYPLTVPPDQCFVLGDNVPISVDSRNIGTIPLANIVGLVQSIEKTDHDLE